MDSPKDSNDNNTPKEELSANEAEATTPSAEAAAPEATEPSSEISAAAATESFEVSDATAETSVDVSGDVLLSEEELAAISAEAEASENLPPAPKSKKSIVIGISALGIAALAGGLFFSKLTGTKKTVDREPASVTPETKHEGPHEDEHAAKPESEHATVEDYKPLTEEQENVWPTSIVGLLKSVHHKAKILGRADLENKRLQAENENLRRWVEEVRFNCSKLSAEKETQETALRLSAETGARIGVVLAGIDYRPPTHIPAKQLLVLGINYFRAREFEKAAVIFSYLTGLADNDQFKTAENILLTGVAWYQINNLKLADGYFNDGLKLARQSKDQKLTSQALLWKALLAQRNQEFGQVQKYLVQILEVNPHSEVAEWVNPQSEDGGRYPASGASSAKDNGNEEDRL